MDRDIRTDASRAAAVGVAWPAGSVGAPARTGAVGHGGFWAASLLYVIETAEEPERHDRGTDLAKAGRGAGHCPVRGDAAPGGYAVDEVRLYGSHARGDFQPDSDVDLAVVLLGFSV